jgi:hypothetical protein
VENRDERDLFLNQPLPSSVDGWVASDGLRLPQEILRVNFARLCFSRYNDSQGFRPPVLFPCGNAVLTHEPNAITLRGPPGIGVNRSVSVTIMDRLPGGGYVEFTSRAVNFSYLPPEVTTVQPRPVPMDGVNTRLITLQGNNFGRIEGSGDAWTAEELAVRVVVGRDTECRDAIRFEDVRSGAIMLRCALGNTPVGSKNLTYTVAGQSGFNDAQAGIATVFAACEGSSPSVFMPAKTPAGPGAYGRDTSGESRGDEGEAKGAFPGPVARRYRQGQGQEHDGSDGAPSQPRFASSGRRWAPAASSAATVA